MQVLHGIYYIGHWRWRLYIMKYLLKVSFLLMYMFHITNPIMHEQYVIEKKTAIKNNVWIIRYFLNIEEVRSLFQADCCSLTGGQSSVWVRIIDCIRTCMQFPQAASDHCHWERDCSKKFPSCMRWCFVNRCIRL